MAIEIERKYLVKQNEWFKYLNSVKLMSFSHITQGYITPLSGRKGDTEAEVRVRIIRKYLKTSSGVESLGLYANICVKQSIESKNSSCAVRNEIETDISVTSAMGLMKLCHEKDSVITKTRYLCPLPDMSDNDTFWEVDVYHGKNKGVITCEIELYHEEQVCQFLPFVGRELIRYDTTPSDKLFSNKNLISYPYSKWETSEELDMIKLGKPELNSIWSELVEQFDVLETPK